jgi:hypothetical protein
MGRLRPYLNVSLALSVFAAKPAPGVRLQLMDLNTSWDAAHQFWYLYH